MVVNYALIIILMLSCALYGDNPDYTALRKQMVEEQLFRRGITDKRILDAFLNVKRHLFVKPELRSKAYEDLPLEFTEGQFVGSPYVVAIMTYAVAPDKTKKVLEIGTGSGYHAAILAELAGNVYTIELVAALSIKAKERLDSMGYENIEFKIGDGYRGWAEHAPYDSIIVTCSEDHIPQPLIKQLAVGGRLIIPVRYADNLQELILLEKLSSGQLKKTNLIPVQTVPSLIRGSGKYE